MNERPPNEREGEPEDADADIVDRHLQRAWQAFSPPSNLRELVRGRLTSSSAATLGAIGMGLASNVRPEGAWASLQASGKLGGLVGAGLLGIGLLSGYWIRDRQQMELPAVIARPSHEVKLAVPAPLVAGLREPERLPPDSAAKAPPPDGAVVPRARRPAQRVAAPETTQPAVVTTQPAVVTAQPGDELALLRRAERAVRVDNAALALALIGELEEQHPNSSLLEERRAIELMAYCSAGASDAVARAQRFLREYPGSAYAGRIRALCPATGSESPSR